MEVVIKIPDEAYELLQHKHDLTIAESIIANGTPLPKGHGRLVDETKITKCKQIGLVIKDGNVIRCSATDAPTIVEADKG